MPSHAVHGGWGGAAVDGDIDARRTTTSAQKRGCAVDSAHVLTFKHTCSVPLELCPPPPLGHSCSISGMPVILARNTTKLPFPGTQEHRRLSICQPLALPALHRTPRPSCTLHEATWIARACKTSPFHLANLAHECRRPTSSLQLRPQQFFCTWHGPIRWTSTRASARCLQPPAMPHLPGRTVPRPPFLGIKSAESPHKTSSAVPRAPFFEDSVLAGGAWLGAAGARVETRASKFTEQPCHGTRVQMGRVRRPSRACLDCHRPRMQKLGAPRGRLARLRRGRDGDGRWGGPTTPFRSRPASVGKSDASAANVD